MSFWKKLGKILAIVVVVGAIVLTGGGAIMGVSLSSIGLTGAVGAVAAGALTGAAAGALATGLWEGNTKNIGKGALIGAMAGGALGYAQPFAAGKTMSIGHTVAANEAGAANIAAAKDAALAAKTPVATPGVNTFGADGKVLNPGFAGEGVKAPTTFMGMAENFLSGDISTGKGIAIAGGLNVAAQGIGGMVAGSAEAAAQAKADEAKRLLDANQAYQIAYNQPGAAAGFGAARPGLIQPSRDVA